MSKVQVAIGQDFLKAFSKLPKGQQKKVREFTEKFRQNPTAKGIKYEKVKDALDPKVRSVRIDQTYRAIVVKPPQGNVYLCAWVDHHDDAYAWARNRRFEVNPRLGHLQVYEQVELDELPPRPEPEFQVPAAPKAPPVPKLLDAVTDDELELFGVPPALLPSIRALKDDTDLDSLAPVLPSDVADALQLLAAGYSAEEVIDELDRASIPAPETVDTGDFGKALEQPDTQRDFKVVDSDKELAEILSAPLETWRVFLHPSQRKLVEWNVNGPIRVLGGAGTGKTVVLMHRARHLAKQCSPEERVLVTTFTRNLARDLENHLRLLCDQEFERLEIVNLHAWAHRFLSAQGVRLKVVSFHKQNEFWEQAVGVSSLDFPLTFFREEWEKVVQARDITQKGDYLRVSRAGRGTPISRRQRADIWKVFEAYRSALERGGVVEWDDIIREARLYLEQNPGLLPYRAVLCDETQDLRPADLRLVRAMVPEGPNDLFLVGDAHQRIYGHKSSFSQCGIEIRGRSRRLKINYRTTDRIGKWAVSVLEGVDFDDLDEGVDTLKGYRSLREGQAPRLCHFGKEVQEGEFLVKTLREWLDQGVPAETICVTARTTKLVEDRYQPLLENAGLDTVLLDSDTPLAELGGGIRLSTMHRMKGLEFPAVVIAGINSSTMPLLAGDFADEASREDREVGERCLLYVAATRARDELVVTGFGEASPFMKREAWAASPW